MKITTIGIDLAKEVFQIHGVDMHGKTGLRKQLRRSEMVKYFANLEPCLTDMEACGSSHPWARKLGEFGHTAKLMSPQFVKPYVKTNKHDMADAEAICEAVSRPNIRFFIDQEHLTTSNSVGASCQTGFCESQNRPGKPDTWPALRVWYHHSTRLHSIGKRMPDILEDAENGLPTTMRRLT
ncbi:transposase [Nitrosomonas sp. Nm166]|nr:transposase [Nitrosomonas sp. Nm166]